MVTSSYVSPEMSALHQSATNEGVCLINECGLDGPCMYVDRVWAGVYIDETNWKARRGREGGIGMGERGEREGGRGEGLTLFMWLNILTL